MTQVLELQAGALRLALRPDLGGCISGLWHGPRPVLHSFDPATLAGSRPSACFPLVPYSNRIGQRRFHWQGQDYELAANVDEPNSLHGVGWQRPWDVVSADATQAELRYAHRADAYWPFDFEARQRFELTPQALRLRMSVRNTDARVQPLGFGWHPYFTKRPGCWLQARVSQRWEPDETLLPVRRVAQEPIDGDVTQMDYDNVFEGWDGVALVGDGHFTVRLTSDQPYLVVFAKAVRDHFCVEPVSHLNNAIQQAEPEAHGLRAVAPGQAIEGFMALEVSTS
ncbi:aldose 1-epimerase [Azohydromonas caseinilytica]|uniref:Aldose 1-epimerase n=1 Tax=Azohydromonas caseinilytica TaxID=2728836 RepID=A0A848F577_9BURK|nr:aldose 1-epimerase [Azohydromonas caseinilytica]NML13796.1 aldose 1-epimerase [Azohydromonas caseinilytica]